VSKLEMKGVLFFSDQHPQVSGYLVIGGEHFELAGWKPIRAEITARPIKGEDNDASGTSARECDSA
jgi:hypothetical protein